MHMITLDTSLLTIIVLVLVFVVFVLCITLFILYRKLTHFMRGKNGTSLEGVLSTILDTQDKITKRHHLLTQEHTVLQQKMSTSVRGMSMVRFNAFKDTGGNQSFAAALINEAGSGIVLSTLFARDRMSVFGKPIHNFTSTQTLSTEEERALAEARQSIE